MKQTPRQMREANIAYEKLVDYLITENYASSKSDADAIIGVAHGLVQTHVLGLQVFSHR